MTIDEKSATLNYGYPFVTFNNRTHAHHSVGNRKGTNDMNTQKMNVKNATPEDVQKPEKAPSAQDVVELDMDALEKVNGGGGISIRKLNSRPTVIEEVLDDDDEWRLIGDGANVLFER